MNITCLKWSSKKRPSHLSDFQFRRRLKQGFFQFVHPAMEPRGCYPLASWKTWWSDALAKDIAKSIHSMIDCTKLPGGGQLLTKDTFRAEDLKDHHVCLVTEAILQSYPKDRQPSGYLLGDAFMQLNQLMNYSLVGPPKSNPILEKDRADKCLAEGGKMKRLLSFVRNSSLKHDTGRTPETQWIKRMANQRVVKSKTTRNQSSPATSSSSSPSPPNFSPVYLGSYNMCCFCFDLLHHKRKCNMKQYHKKKTLIMKCGFIPGALSHVRQSQGKVPCRWVKIVTSTSLTGRWSSWGALAIALTSTNWIKHDMENCFFICFLRHVGVQFKEWLSTL